MTYHPRDTVAARQSCAKIENLWYKVHYFQVRDHSQANSEKRVHPLEKNISLEEPARKELSEIINKNRDKILGQSGFVHISLRARANTRILVGMGGAHCRENSLTLHPVYGIPYIPGSSVKGLMRNWFLYAFFDRDEKTTECLDEKLNDDKGDWKHLYEDLFGTQEARGFMVCHDVFLGPDCRIVPDVMTVHFQSYYRDKDKFVDSDNPNPISFYAVDTGQRAVEFLLSIEKAGARQYSSHLKPEDLARAAALVLKRALEELGIGSKTSSGYGSFQVTEFQQTHPAGMPAVQRPSTAAAAIENARPANKKLLETLDETIDESLVGRIKRLNHQNAKDVEDSKGQIFPQVRDSQDVEAALALLEFWQKCGEVPGKNDKQKRRVNDLQKIIEGKRK